MQGASSTKKKDEQLLPANYDQLLPAEKLIHGEHNPRRVQPSETLRRSVKNRGLNRPLVVHPDSGRDVYHITDGWQRYQAATDCGWEQLPVQVYDSPLAALRATEVESIGRDWSTMDWANYYQSLADEIEAESQQQLIEKVVEMTDSARSTETVRQYLDVLSLPEEIQPLLRDGPEGSDQAWAALRNYNEDVRRYDGFRWTDAHHLARQQSSLPRSRVIGIAAYAVTFGNSDDTVEFIREAADNPTKSLDTVRREVLIGQQHPRYIEIPRTVVRMDRSEKDALMEYCREQEQSLSKLVTESVESLAADAVDD